ncbi:C4b-binding protein beta chain [Tympanuchus pallidicinctus]|uniref:C4b-binding protein beta chain n=1 Tax=Tympanuchus pallidicinctus TaxID=109042 RepID=UPI0022870747|nr:C4b-binding protein beta chain [Tympanuchus pallidicinctus]
MVLTSTLSILGCSALLLAAVSGQQVRQRRCAVPHIENGRSAPFRYVYRPGDSVRFTCNTGYTLQGSFTSICQADFSWSPPLPACKKGKCCVCVSGAAAGQSSLHVLSYC